jgi:hypothetical protein
MSIEAASLSVFMPSMRREANREKIEQPMAAIGRAARNHMSALDGLTGEEIARPRLCDLAAGVESAEALLVEIARPRMGRGGISVPPSRPAEGDFAIRPYRLLDVQHGRAAYGQYNALHRRIVSFERALERRWSGQQAEATS